MPAGNYDYEWVYPLHGASGIADSLNWNGGARTFSAPFSGDVLLYLIESPERPPTGDFDEDGDVDLDDFGRFQVCFSGPVHAYPPGCAYADLDSNGVVDANDLDIFSNCVGGSQLPTPCAGE